MKQELLQSGIDMIRYHQLHLGLKDIWATFWARFQSLLKMLFKCLFRLRMPKNMRKSEVGKGSTFQLFWNIYLQSLININVFRMHRTVLSTILIFGSSTGLWDNTWCHTYGFTKGVLGAAGLCHRSWPKILLWAETLEERHEGPSFSASVVPTFNVPFYNAKQ